MATVDPIDPEPTADEIAALVIADHPGKVLTQAEFAEAFSAIGTELELERR